MRDSKGVTLISVIIYLIGITLLIALVSTLTNFIYTDISIINNSSQNLNEYIKFNMFFLEDIKEKGNSVYKIENQYSEDTVGEEQTQEIISTKLIFTNGNQYTFIDEAIYKNNVKICENITNVEWTAQIDSTTKNTIVNVLITVGESVEYTKAISYTMVK